MALQYLLKEQFSEADSKINPFYHVQMIARVK
jgi:hypothetical protein